MRKKLLALLLPLLCLVGLKAQQLDPVGWEYSVEYPSETEADLVFTATLDAGWHLYSQHTSPDGPLPSVFEFQPSAAYTLVGEVKEPKPHEEMDEVFRVVVRSFEGKVVFRQRILRQSKDDFEVRGVHSYQLCNDGSCIAPDDRDFLFRVRGAQEKKVAAAVAAEPEEDTLAAEPEEEVVEEMAEAIVQMAEEAAEENEGGKNLLVVFLLAVGSGVLVMFTPCVFPMIPMTVNFFVRGAENKRRARLQAWFFGLSIVFIFAVLGVVLTLAFGPEVLYRMGTSWVVNLVFFAVFFVFALSFFGLFELKMPERWINGSDERADVGNWMAPFFIALTTVLVSFSCTGPILGSALVGLTHTDSVESANRWVSLVTMLGFGIGFALPFTLLAMFPQLLKNMKSGSWLNTVKIVFAFLEVAFGLKFLQMADQAANWGLLPREVYLSLWIVVFAMLGFYLLGKLRFKGDSPVEEIGTLRLFLAIADLAFVVWMVPGLWGAPLKPISGFLPEMSTQDFNVERIVMQNASRTAPAASTDRLPADRRYADVLEMPVGFEGFFDIEEAKAYAKKVNKPIFLDFTGKTCANCREMEQNVWVDTEVRRLLTEDFIICSLYADANFIELSEEEWVRDEKGHILKTLGRKNLNFQKTQYQMNAQPYYVIIDAEGNSLTAENYKYDRDVQKFVRWLNEGKNNYRKQ